MPILSLRLLLLIFLIMNRAAANPLPELPPGPSIDRIRGTLDIPFLSVWQYTAICIGLTLLGLWLVVFFYQRIRANNEPIDQLSPYDLALKTLNTLNSEKDSTQVGEKIIYTLCKFFEESLKIKAHGRSCSAILQQLDLDKSDNEQLANIWNDCNHAKFGQAIINEDCRTLLIKKAVAIINAAHANEVREEN